MNRRERLMNTLQGKPVDRPAACFYEINGLDEKKNDTDPFNIYSHPSWHPLIDLAREKSDRIVMRSVSFKEKKKKANTLWNPEERLATGDTEPKTENYMENGSRLAKTTIKTDSGILTSITRRDPDVNTTWTIEHLLKNTDDLKAWIDLPENELSGAPDISGVLEAEKELGDTGIVMINSPDPLCCVAPLLDMAEFTIIALTEQKLFHKALEKASRSLHAKTEAVAKALPGRLWRICGPEYAAPPYLPPHLFEEYVVKYISPMIESIQKYGGYARIHSHGMLKDILGHIASTGCDALDPIEPPPQGDVELKYVRKNYGKNMVLFGNLEASDLENLPADRFSEKVKRALDEGTSGEGRGFVLLPSACPYGRELSSVAMRNYEKIIECIEN